MSVRKAGIGDLPHLVKMSKQFFDASGYGMEMAFSDKSTKTSLEELMTQHILLVHGDPPEGMIGLILGSQAFNRNQKMAVELFWWVNPGSNGIGRELLIEAEKQAKIRGAQHISMLSLQSMSPDRVDEIYKRMGYQLREFHYLKAL